MKANIEKRQMSSWALCMLLLPLRTVARECDQEYSGFKQTRIFVAVYKGAAITPIGDEESAAKNLGSCRTTAEHAEKMFEYFQAYGIDLGPMRSKPYEIYETAAFQVTPHVVNPTGNYTIILNSFYEYAQVTSSPLMFSSWVLSAKTDLSSREKRLPTGYWSIFGMFRFSDRGRDFCMGYTEWNPLEPFLPGRGVTTINWRLENEIWGIGNFTGLGKVENGTFDGRYFLQLITDIIK